MSQPTIILIGGPTASGKSALAMRLAHENNGVIINADAMQVYRDLPILTAQPSDQDRAAIPHRLYEITDPATASSAGIWLTQARAAIADTVAEGRTPILVGGTGMYFHALLGGLADIPPIPDATRTAAQKLYDDLGEDKFRASLAQRDADAAQRIARNDRQRLVRAYEVVEHTGRTLGQWQEGARDEGTENKHGELRKKHNENTARISSPSRGLGPIRKTSGGRFSGTEAEGWLGWGAMTNEMVSSITYQRHLLLPPRDQLYAVCDGRFLDMMKRGALDEVRALLARNLQPDLPAMKILGVPELAAHLRGELSLNDAIAKAQQHTRNYAKRQMTWFRNRWPTD